MPNSIALRLACHDPAVHRKLVPGGQQARAVFDAVEQARVEAIGSRRMGGVAKNLAAMLDDRFHRGKYDEITDRADAPIEDALAMIVRERLTGENPPPPARKLVELWRPLIEERAGRDLDRLERVLTDQRRFGDVVHDLLDCLDMGEDRSSESEEEEGEDGEDKGADDDSAPDGESAENADADRVSPKSRKVRPTTKPINRPRRSMRRRPRWPTMPKWVIRKPPPSRGGRATAATTRAGPNTGHSPQGSTRPSAPRICATPRSSTACVAISTSNSRICRAWWRGSPTGCSGGCSRSRTGRGSSIWKKGCSIRRGFRA